MTAKSVFMRPQGLHLGARAPSPPCYGTAETSDIPVNSDT